MLSEKLLLILTSTVVIITVIISLVSIYGQPRRAVAAANNDNGAAGNNEINYPHHLTLQDFERIISTETSTDFGFTSSLLTDDVALGTQVESTWNDAIFYEWTKALDGTASSQKYPYILCHKGPEMSGYKRRLALVSAIESIEPGDSDGSEIYLHTLYNKDDSLCVFAHLHASVAIKLLGVEYIVQPVLASSKMIKDSVDAIEKEIDEVLSIDAGGDPNYRPITIHMGLCPGVKLDNTDNEVESSFQETGGDLEGVGGYISEAITNKLLGGNGAAEGLTSTGSSSAASASFLPLSQEIYLTSEAHSDQTTPSRAEMWSTLLDSYQLSGRCDKAYNTGLKWKVGFQASRLDLFPSQMEVEYNISGEMEIDRGCGLVLCKFEVT